MSEIRTVEKIVKSWRSTDKHPCPECGKKLSNPEYTCKPCGVKLKLRMNF